MDIITKFLKVTHSHGCIKLWHAFYYHANTFAELPSAWRGKLELCWRYFLPFCNTWYSTALVNEVVTTVRCGQEFLGEESSLLQHLILLFQTKQLWFWLAYDNQGSWKQFLLSTTTALKIPKESLPAHSQKLFWNNCIIFIHQCFSNDPLLLGSTNKSVTVSWFSMYTLFLLTLPPPPPQDFVVGQLFLSPSAHSAERGFLPRGFSFLQEKIHFAVLV